MSDYHSLLKNLETDIKYAVKEYKRLGGNYGLFVLARKLIGELDFLATNLSDDASVSTVEKLFKSLNKFHRELLLSLKRDELEVLAKHGNTDAYWIIAAQIFELHLKNVPSEAVAPDNEHWENFYSYLEQGTQPYLLDGDECDRVLYLCDYLVFGPIKDLTKAINYLECVIEDGTSEQVANAHYLLWEIYQYELEEKDFGLAHLKSAVQLKHPDAIAAYGRAHWGDWLVECDERKAFTLIREASRLGSQRGHESLAECYSLGLGTRKNAPKAFKLRMMLGEDYDDEICCKLAEHYMNGEGTEVDNKEGKRLLNKAMKMGSGRAHWVAAREHGSIPSSKNLQTKRFNILKAAYELKEPYVLTINPLGVCYFYGDGTTQDYDKARKCFERLLELDPIPSLEDEAKLYLQALNSDDPEAELERILDEID